jgi:osmotically-inducible protein OsmY
MTTATVKPDAQIKSEVLDELRWEPSVNETEVGVQVRNGVVTLTGSIGSYPKKLAAIKAAHRVLGVLDVVDDMRVSIPRAWERSDEEIAKAVRTALRWDVTVPDERITSTVAGGMVTLEGTVDTWVQRYDAERAVQRLTGVKGVRNRVAVSPGSADPDAIKR